MKGIQCGFVRSDFAHGPCPVGGFQFRFKCLRSETFQVISLGFNTCVPKLSFTAKVPCPLCCALGGNRQLASGQRVGPMRKELRSWEFHGLLEGHSHKEFADAAKTRLWTVLSVGRAGHWVEGTGIFKV